MIELRTGIPGSGKTLSMVEALSKMPQRWEKHPEEARPIFVHNVKDLALPHAVMPLKKIQAGQREQLVPDWDAMPDGSLVVIDECQDVFPPRSSQTVAPGHIAWLNTHRHKGFDIWVTTQHPKLIDFSLRALVGKHVHFRRLFGGARAATYEWDGCSDSLGGMKDSVMSFYSFPKKAYQFYKSAEVHTKQKFKLPRWLIIPVLGVALGLFALPRAYNTLSGAMAGKGIAAKAATTPAPQAGVNGAIAPIGTSASAPRPPSSPGESKPVATLQPVLGCIKMADRCECFDQNMMRVQVAPAVCDESSHRVGTLAMPVIQATSTGPLPDKQQADPSTSSL